jgi:predicted Zn-dependent peptidase
MKAPSLTIQAYHRAVWRPERATLVVVGRVDAKTVEAYAASAFAGWTANGDARALGKPPELPDAGRTVTSIVDARLLSSVSLACRVPDEPAVADVAQALLDERLFATVREAPTAAYAPSTGVVRLPGTALLQVSAGVDPVRGGATADAFVAAIGSLGGLTDADVARALDRVRRSAVVGRVSGDDVLNAVLAPPPGPAPTPGLVRSWFASCAGHESITIVGPVKRPFAGTSLDGAKSR